VSWLALVAGSYLLGSVSFSVLIVRAVRGFDLRERGSGNAGATNTLRTAGPVAAVAVLLLDVGKGVAAVLAARALGAPGPVVGAAAGAAVVGHTFPLYYGLRGGKGVATATGALGTLAPLPALPAAAVFFAVVAATRYVSLGSICALALFPAFVYLAGRVGWTEPAPGWLLATAAGVAALVVGKHRGNLERLIAGEENRLGERRDREEEAG